MRVDWTNQWRDPSMLGFDEGRTAALAMVEDAVRWGADAVLTYMFVGLDDPAAEANEIRRNAEINRSCERLGIVHIVESVAPPAAVWIRKTGRTWWRSTPALPANSGLT